MVKIVTISLHDHVLEQIDSIKLKCKCSRGEVIAKAMHKFKEV